MKLHITDQEAGSIEYFVSRHRTCTPKSETKDTGYVIDTDTRVIECHKCGKVVSYEVEE